jgi:cytochrome c oxidase cbb3-type subunit I/II
MAYDWHRPYEARWVAFTAATLVAVAIGGLVLLVPPFFLQGTITPIEGLRPYRALEQEGRDLYIREGCNTCHSQQVRPLKTETDRYGPYSRAGEGIYDRPFLWGSRRTGPDLARVGGKYPNSWHWLHLRDPRSIEPRSNMPDFAFLLDTELDTSLTARRLEVLQRLGHPYSAGEIANAVADARAQAGEIAASLERDGIELSETQANSEAIALIAYLQSLGRAIQAAPASVARLEEAR